MNIQIAAWMFLVAWVLVGIYAKGRVQSVDTLLDAVMFGFGCTIVVLIAIVFLFLFVSALLGQLVV